MRCTEAIGQLREKSSDRELIGGRAAARVCAGALAFILIACSSWVVAADADEIEELKRAVKALRDENRALSERVRALEDEKSRSGQTSQSGASPAQQPIRPPSATAERKEREQLEQRVEELEKSKTAQEDAVRTIVRESFAKTGSMINEFVNLGGTLEVTGGRTKDFSGVKESQIALSTAQLEFEVRVNPWTLGNLVIEYDPGTNVTFPTSNGFEASVDRINLDTAFIMVGDTQRFPPFLKAGRVVLPFGISTGSAWADVLSIENPLTVEVFETRKTAVGFGLAFPTPALRPATPPVAVPPVKPLVVNPLVSSISRSLGYQPPPERPKPLPLVFPAPAPPMFNAGVYFYSGNTETTTDGRANLARHVNANVGFNTRGHCGRRYDQLSSGGFCPWTIDLNLSYNSSVYDSLFLQAEYAAFLNQIGLVPGASASLKSSLGPVAIVAEWNGALDRTTFVDNAGRRVTMQPSAWQLSLGYQFDWNPWVETIGDQGTYVSVGYSQSADLAGVTQSINGVPTRVGFVPQRRLILTGGEWVLDGLRLALEYSYNWDYPRSVGGVGTGNRAHGLFASLLYVY